jgi:hypothetical protein
MPGGTPAASRRQSTSGMSNASHGDTPGGVARPLDGGRRRVGYLAKGDTARGLAHALGALPMLKGTAEGARRAAAGVFGLREMDAGDAVMPEVRELAF